MFVTLKTLPALLAAGLMASTATLFAQGTMDSEFEALAKRYLDGLPKLSPVSATLLGDHRLDGELDEVSLAANARAAAFHREHLEALGRIRRAALSRANQVDAALLEHRLRADLWQLEEYGEWAWNPLLYTGLLGDAIYGLMARDFAPLPERLEHLAARLEQFPRLAAEIRGILAPERVPPVHAETAVKQNRGVPGMLDDMVKPHLPSLAAPARERLERAMTMARVAVEALQEWLEKELLPKAGGDFRQGAERFDRKLAFTLQSSLSRQEIRRRAEAELQRVRAEMYEIAKGVYLQAHPYTKHPALPDDAYKQAVIRAALEIAYWETPAPDSIVEEARRSLALAEAFVRKADLVTVPADPVEIIIMPEFRRGVSIAYCDSPGPLDVGQKTFYAVAPLPADWTAEQVKSFLREYNLRSLHNLTVHEAVPGHFLQLAHSNRYPSTLRAVLASGVFVEGWAVYTEHMMVERGFLDGDPLMRLVVRKWYLRGIVNAIIDQAIHAEGMTREAALELMIEGAFQEEREAAAKWVRAQLTSTQLSTYFVGFQEHMDLRGEVEKAQGEKFSLKAYHDRLLSFGSPPVRFARALLLDLPIGG